MAATATAAEEEDRAVLEAAVAKPKDNTPVVIVLSALASADADIEGVTLIVPDALEVVLAIINEVVVGEAWATGAITM